MHATFPLLVAWWGASRYFVRHHWPDVWGGVASIFVLFAIVVLHELGHALAARKFGIRTHDITLLPIGGVARLERMPQDPKQELIVALAGPAVNAVFVVLLLPWLMFPNILHRLQALPVIGGDFVGNLMWINLLLAAFNLIPAFPMDGGRVLRAFLAMRIDYVRATNIAANLGQGFALVLGFSGLFSNPFLVFIALFVWIGAAGEAATVQMKSALSGIPINRAMATEFRTLSPDETLQDAAQHVVAGFQQDFPVVEDGRLVGVLTRANLLRILAEDDRHLLVSEAMNKNFVTAQPSEMLESAFQRLQTCECHSIPVVENGRVLGILTVESLGELLVLQPPLKAKANQIVAG
jgi:Zn-dependent protease/CBS domain-containing protein